MPAVEENSKSSDSAKPNVPDPLHIWTGLADAPAANAWVEHHLAASRACIADLLAITGPRTVDNTLVPYDRACWHLRMAGSQSGVMFMVHPLADVRDAAQQLSQVIGAESVALSLNRDVYQALAALNTSVIAAPASADPATLYYLDRALLGYRLSGVDKDEPTRTRIRALADNMTQLSMTFSRAVQDDVRNIPVDNPDDLLGLPDDYLARHGVHPAKASDDGPYLVADAPVVLTTDPPEMAPVMSYAISPQLRRCMYLAYNDRAYPANKQVLLDLLAAREEMATLLGFRSWADLATVDQMMGSAANMRTFLNEVEAAALETARQEFAELEDFVRERDPNALPLTLSDARFWEEQFRRARYDFDSQSVRPYFPYEQVEAGILTTAGKLFGVTFARAQDAVVWAPGVKAFNVLDNDPTSPTHSQPIGRIYLDMHPREGKSKWFSECSLVSGVLNHQLPEASLVCNFPQPTATDAGLLQYSDVVTCFHEFGHLMHEVLGGRQRWAGQSGISTEGDFVEVPSQMLEEFFEDPELVRTFARHYKTGEPIPHDVFARMVRASAHGRALATLTQVMYATYSMETHDKPVADLDLDALLRTGYDRFSRYEFVDGNRMYSAFTHLVGYTSNYYTYLYDKVMALEFFEQFDANNLIEGPTALRYRREVLEPGGSKPARDLVQSFLGREVSMSALKQWIAREFDSQ
ncbi:MAG TPA: M3 family metallopeptidase [Acidobacteriaceae bacterium]|nr:M3 family metallopeptidase [Acidobacteriaceae bacterium]